MCKSTRNKNTSAPGPADAAATPPPPPVPKPAITKIKEFKNPLNDPAIALILPQPNNGIATNERYAEERNYKIYVPAKLATDFANAPAASKPTARVAVFYGVDPEMSLFRLRAFFANETNSVLVTVPGVESENLGVPAGEDSWRGVHQAFGFGITTQMINDLFTLAGLNGIVFNVEVMAGYSTGYRGVSLTVINQLVDLSKLSRLVYLDAWYHFDDSPKMTSGPFIGKNVQFAIDTAFKKNPAVQIVIYAFTNPGGVPRTTANQSNKTIPNPPREPVAALIAAHPGQISFIDFEFKFGSKPAIDDALEKICLARLIQLGLQDAKYAATAIAAPLKALVDVLPERGSFGVLGFPGYSDLYGWVASNSSVINGFSITAAMKMVTQFKLLQTWTTTSHYEMRHREFVLELGKEQLLPH